MQRKQKLELTWIGKENRPRLEPRILLEDASMSYHAPQRVSENDLFDNRLIFGDNLLALRALEAEFAGKIKCIYIDPPFNTGAAFDHYDDGIEHSQWLSLMRQRLVLLHGLLSTEGSLFLHLDDNEVDYCKVLLDEIFGRTNFVNRISVDARAPSAFSTVNPGVFKASEYILWYARDKARFWERPVRVRRQPDYAYNKWIKNPGAPPSEWTFSTLMEAYESAAASRSRRPDSLLEHFNKFIIENADRVCRLASISDSGAGQSVVDMKRESERTPGTVLKVERGEDLDPVYILDGQQVIFYSKNVTEIDGELCATAPLTNVWTDIAWEGIATEGGVTFKKGKKPERLVKRCLELATNPGEWVLDSFAGSGTTGAVAHKMGRRWIMVELGEHCHTHIIPRLKKVIDGDDKGRVTEATGWKGGGGFRYARIAPSLLEKDRFGNWVIRKEYNAAMLAEALCKLEGFTYAPSDSEYWRHGYSTERDFIYVTTQSLTRDMLVSLSDEVGEDRTLLVLCKAFRSRAAFPNLTVKKIPKAVMAKCEWGKDDYSLAISALPDAEPTAAQDEAPSTPKRSVARGSRKAKAEQAALFEVEASPAGGKKGSRR